MSDSPPNLEYWRKQAKALLKAARKGDAEALLRTGPDPALNDAQRALAREQGFLSWPKFHTFIVESRLDEPDLVARFVAAATSDGRRAWVMLKDHPELARAGFHAWLVLGGYEGVATVLKSRPELATAKSGPEDIEALAYVCFSRFGHARSPRADKVVRTARLLLDAGADPDTAIEGDEGRLSCLYAASGLLNNPELTRLLLEAGADTDDGESLYHACEHPDLSCLRLLLEHGGDANGTNVLKHMLDYDNPAGVRLLLDHGADPNVTSHLRDTALHWAVRRGRSVEVVRMLIDGGADIDAVRADGRTAYAMAMADGQTEVAGLLATRGADTRLSPLDAFIAGEDVAVPKESADIPGNTWLMCQLAENGNVRGIERMLKAGVPVGGRGGMGETALHWACWKGNPDLVRLLIAHNAPFDVKETTYNAPPAGWLHHGSTNCGQGDYAACARLLIDAGGWTESSPSGNPDLDAVLREKGLIA